jgi:phosphomevalonate kinase
MSLVATAPGKLILTGEYAVLDGAPALVLAVDRRVIAAEKANVPAGSSPFLVALADELTERGNGEAAARVMGIRVDSSAFYGDAGKLGLGSSAAVTVAATALALGEPLDRKQVLAVALAAHARAQAQQGAAGSGADVAAAVHGGAIVFTAGAVEARRWPATVRLVPFFTGQSADTRALIARVTAARVARRIEVEAALRAIGDASRAACAALAAPVGVQATALLGALALASVATDQLALAAGVELVPGCVTAARQAVKRLGGVVKTTGAGGGDVAVAVVPAAADEAAVRAALDENGCQILDLHVDESGVDLRPDAS